MGWALKLCELSVFDANSAPESLGPVWGVHIWHDNSGPSPEWYLTQVEVSEVSSTCLWVVVVSSLCADNYRGLILYPGE